MRCDGTGHTQRESTRERERARESVCVRESEKECVRERHIHTIHMMHRPFIDTQAAAAQSADDGHAE